MDQGISVCSKIYACSAVQLNDVYLANAERYYSEVCTEESFAYYTGCELVSGSVSACVTVQLRATTMVSKRQPRWPSG